MDREALTRGFDASLLSDLLGRLGWQRFGVSVEEAEWVLVLYRFQTLYPDGPEPGRFYCEAL